MMRIFLFIFFVCNSLFSADFADLYDNFIKDNYKFVYNFLSLNGKSPSDNSVTDFLKTYAISSKDAIQEMTIFKNKFLNNGIKRVSMICNQKECDFIKCMDMESKHLNFCIFTATDLVPDYIDFHESDLYYKELHDYYKNLLTFILIKPLDFIETASETFEDIPANDSITIPQGAGLIETITTPLVSGSIYDCVGIYMFTSSKYDYISNDTDRNIHMLIHYDRISKINTIKNHMETFVKAKQSGKHISTILFTNCYSSQLIDIIDTTLSLGLDDIKFGIKPSQCFSQGGLDSINIYGEHKFQTIHVTCKNGQFLIRETKNEEDGLFSPTNTLEKGVFSAR